MPRLLPRAPLGVQTKLQGSFLVIVGLLVVLGAVGLRVMSDVNQHTQAVINAQRKSTAYRQVQYDTVNQLYEMSSAMLGMDDLAIDSALQMLSQSGDALDRLAFVAPDEMPLFDRVRQDFKDFIAVMTRAVALTHDGKSADARDAWVKEAQPIANRLRQQVNELVDKAQSADIVGIEEGGAAYSRMRIIVGGFAIASILLAIILARVISRSLKSLTARVTDNTKRVAMAATQASSAISQVSDGSNMQLAALQRSAGALGQSSLAIAEVARSTQLASEQAKEAAQLVADGIEQMTLMLDVVNAISDGSTQVSQIAGTISRIASQTNMLALNAAIEAARAGEHGRGFAVVAEEVRKLAENSGSLAREIAGLVEHATAAATRGVEMAQQVSDNMRQIASGVQQSDRLVDAIAAAMEEQDATVKGINSNVAELTRIGQSNAAAAEQITATMLDLSKLAERSRVDVDEFAKVGL